MCIFILLLRELIGVKIIEHAFAHCNLFICVVFLLSAEQADKLKERAKIYNVIICEEAICS